MDIAAVADDDAGHLVQHAGAIQPAADDRQRGRAGRIGSGVLFSEHRRSCTVSTRGRAAGCRRVLMTGIWRSVAIASWTAASLATWVVSTISAPGTSSPSTTLSFCTTLARLMPRSPSTVAIDGHDARSVQRQQAQEVARLQQAHRPQRRRLAARPGASRGRRWCPARSGRRRPRWRSAPSRRRARRTGPCRSGRRRPATALNEPSTLASIEPLVHQRRVHARLDLAVDQARDGQQLDAIAHLARRTGCRAARPG